MKHVFIMDALEQVKPWKDTTYHLMRACVERGHRVGCLDQRDLWLAHDRAHATVNWLQVHPYDAQTKASPFHPIGEERIDLSQVDAVWIRTDPPFDRRYFYTTLLLEHLPPKVRVINRPATLRDWNEKLAALAFPALTPPTVVDNDCARILAFARRHRRITLKPVDGFGGKGIVFYRDGEDPRAVRAAIGDRGDRRHWIIAQAYLPQARDGDKRILLLNGEILGGILRMHADGADLNNLDAGGSAHPLELNDRDREICAALKPALIERGVFFAGIDIIGRHLIEINVTSPTGLQELCRFSGEDHHHRIIAALER